MNREKVKRLADRLGGGRVKACIFWDDRGSPDYEPMIYCELVNTKIPLADCPSCSGGVCESSDKLIHVIIHRVRAGPNGEVQTYGTPDWPYEDDHDSETQTPIEKE